MFHIEPVVKHTIFISGVRFTLTTEQVAILSMYLAYASSNTIKSNYVLKQKWGTESVKLTHSEAKTVDILVTAGHPFRPFKIHLSESEVHSLLHTLDKYREKSWGTVFEIPCYFGFHKTAKWSRWIHEDYNNENLFVNTVKDPARSMESKLWINLPIALLEIPEKKEVIAIRGNGPEFSSKNWISYAFEDLANAKPIGN